MKPIIIGLIGKKKSGKDTIASMMLDILHDDPEKINVVMTTSFAAALKREVCEGCGISYEYLTEHKDNFRLILQGWGTNFRRQLCGEDYWVKKVESEILTLNNTDYVIITDVRFQNEADMIRKMSGQLVRVIREETDDYTDLHPSEEQMDMITPHHTIDNDSDIEALKIRTNILLQEINGNITTK